jgi:hypothetical protein
MHTSMSLHGWCLFFRNPIFSIFGAFRVYFLHLSGSSPNSVFAQCHEMRKGFSELHVALNSVEWRTKQFYCICVHIFMSDIFFSHLWCSQNTVLVESHLTFHWTDFGQYLSDDFPILFEFKTFCTTIILNNLHRFLSGKVQYFLKLRIWKIK